MMLDDTARVGPGVVNEGTLNASRVRRIVVDGPPRLRLVLVKQGEAVMRGTISGWGKPVHFEAGDA